MPTSDRGMGTGMGLGMGMGMGSSKASTAAHLSRISFFLSALRAVLPVEAAACGVEAEGGPESLLAASRVLVLEWPITSFGAVDEPAAGEGNLSDDVAAL